MAKIILYLTCVCLLIAALHGAAVENKQASDDHNSPTTTINPLDVHEDCHQPMVTGRCFALFYRFGYNVEKGKCERFVYGGCGGNSNNFERKEDCEKKCLKKLVPEVEEEEPVEDQAPAASDNVVAWE